MAAQHFFAKAWSLSFERYSKKIRDFVKNLLLITIGSKICLFLVLKQIRSSLHFSSLIYYSWNLSAAARFIRVHTAVWMLLF